MTGQNGPNEDVDRSSHVDKMTVTQMRWDHADLLLYCSITGVNLHPVLDQMSLSKSGLPTADNHFILILNWLGMLLLI